MELQKKISIAKFAGKMTAARVVKAGGRLRVGVFMGVARGTKRGTSDFGDWTALIGDFRAINTDTGEEQASQTLFLPAVAQDGIVATLESGAQAVEFAFHIIAVEDDASQVGFSYRAEPMLQAAESDPVARIKAQIAALLPAPKE